MIPDYDKKELYPHKNALSSSQFLLYEKDPEAFFLKYSLGAKEECGKAANIGRVFSWAYRCRMLKEEFDPRPALLEAGVTPKMIDLFIAAVAKFPVIGGQPELPMWCTFKGWKFRATLDNYLDWNYHIIENKTGSVEWTQERVNFSDQLTFQAWVHWKATGVQPKKIDLNWWNTKCTSYVDIRPFKTSRSITNLKQFEKRVEAVIESLEAGNFTHPIY